LKPAWEYQPTQEHVTECTHIHTGGINDVQLTTYHDTHESKVTAHHT